MTKKKQVAKKNLPNSPCYCGSGVKYKRCHGKIKEDLRREAFMREKYTNQKQEDVSFDDNKTSNAVVRSRTTLDGQCALGADNED